MYCQKLLLLKLCIFVTCLKEINLQILRMLLIYQLVVCGSGVTCYINNTAKNVILCYLVLCICLESQK